MKQGTGIFNIFKLFLCYICFFITYNFGNIIYNYLKNKSFNLDISFLNLSILISLAIIGLFYFFKVKRKTLKILMAIFIFYTFISAFFINHEITSFTLIYLFLITITFVILLKFNTKFEISIVISTSALLIILFLLGITNLLFITKYVVLLIYVISFVYILFNKDKLKSSITKNNTLSMLIIFTILFIIAYTGGLFRNVHIWDEFSHWAYDAKSVIYYNKLSTFSESFSKFRAYPPIITLWHYFINVFSSFKEEHLYMGLNILTFIYLMPALSFFKEKNKLYLGMFTYIVFNVCFLFSSISGIYSYNNLYADLLISCVFLSSILIYYNDDIRYIKKIVLSLIIFILTLSKPSGFILSFAILLIIFINELTIKKLNIKNIFISIKQYFKNNYIFVLSIILSLLLWIIHLFISGQYVTQFYDFSLLPNSLKSNISLKLNSGFILKFINNVLISFDDDMIFCIINIKYKTFIILTFGLLYYNYYIQTKNYKKAINKLVPFVISYIIFYFATLLSIFVTFSVYEASMLASFMRYLNNYNYALLLFTIICLYNNNFFKTKINKIIIFLLMCSSISFINTFYFIGDYNDRMESKNVYYRNTDKFKHVIDNTKKTDKIYVINQQDIETIMPIWYSRYYLFPRKINSSGSIDWKIKTKLNKDDLQNWGFTAKTLIEHLKKNKIDYIYFYSYDKEMEKELNEITNDQFNLHQYDLYKIIYENNIITFKGILCKESKNEK